MHKVAADISAAISIPLLHIADATADVLLGEGISTVGLLGTRFTMEQSFYTDRLLQKGLKVRLPDQSERDTVHRIIYEELCLGLIKPQSRQQYLDIISQFEVQGVDAVILGCTEISLLVRPSDTRTVLYDTAAIHAQQAVKAALTTL